MPDSSQTDREFYRVRAQVGLRYGPETPHARQAMAMDAEVWRSQSSLEAQARKVWEDQTVSDDVKPLLTVMRWLDFKLDMVLHQLRQQQLERIFPHQGATTDISGSGLSFITKFGTGANQRLIMSIALPDAPGRPVFAVGEVLRVEPSEVEGHELVAVNLIELADEDRERIIRYVFGLQRRELALRAEEEHLK